MRNDNPAHRRGFTAARPRRASLRDASAHRPSLQLISDGVVASYIHDISARHGHDRSAARRGGDQVAHPIEQVGGGEVAYPNRADLFVAQRT